MNFVTIGLVNVILRGVNVFLPLLPMLVKFVHLQLLTSYKFLPKFFRFPTFQYMFIFILSPNTKDSFLCHIVPSCPFFSNPCFQRCYSTSPSSCISISILHATYTSLHSTTPNKSPQVNIKSLLTANPSSRNTVTVELI